MPKSQNSKSVQQSDTEVRRAPSSDKVKIEWTRVDGKWTVKPTCNQVKSPISLASITNIIESAERSATRELPKAYEGRISVHGKLSKGFQTQLKDCIVGWIDRKQLTDLQGDGFRLTLKYLTNDDIRGKVAVPSVSSSHDTMRGSTTLASAPVIPAPPDPQTIDGGVLNLLEAVRELREKADVNDPIPTLQKLDETLTEMRRFVGLEISAVFNRFAGRRFDLNTSKLIASQMDDIAKSLRLLFNCEDNEKCPPVLTSLRCIESAADGVPQFRFVSTEKRKKNTHKATRMLSTFQMMPGPSDSRRMPVSPTK